MNLISKSRLIGPPRERSHLLSRQSPGTVTSLPCVEKTALVQSPATSADEELGTEPSKAPQPSARFPRQGLGVPACWPAQEPGKSSSPLPEPGAAAASEAQQRGEAFLGSAQPRAQQRCPQPWPPGPLAPLPPTGEASCPRHLGWPPFPSLLLGTSGSGPHWDTVCPAGRVAQHCPQEETAHYPLDQSPHWGSPSRSLSLQPHHL